MKKGLFNQADNPVAAVMSTVLAPVATQSKQTMEVELWKPQMSDGKASLRALSWQQ